MNMPPQNLQKIMNAIESVVKILSAFSSDERKQILQGTAVILREPTASEAMPDAHARASTESSLPAKAKLWMKQNKVSDDELAQVFDITDGVATFIAGEVSGKNNSEKTIKAYVLAGLGGLFSVGEGEFVDKAARELCESFGCYDSSNHSKYMKDKGSNFIGSKEKGWKLTSPGLKYGASIIKELASGANA